MLKPLMLTLLCVLYSVGVHATERKAYKHVDEKGNVTYSQTPPSKDAKPIDITPAHQGRGGYPSASNIPYRSGDDRASQYASEQQRKRDEAQKRRLAQLEAECTRGRGTDCKNPNTLRDIESQHIPRRGH